MTTGDPGVIIAIIDTGVDYTHTDLTANIWQNTGEVDGDDIDNDGNGYVDDIRGWDFVSVDAEEVYSGEDPGPPDNDPMDVQEHGTHVAGIAGAVGNNSTGIAGVCWNSKLMVLRAGYKSTSGQGLLQISDIADALMYAADNGADVINMSFGSDWPSETERVAIEYAENNGCVLVAAAGNDYSGGPHFPASFKNVISVASTSDSSDTKSAFSNYGLGIDVAAPGGQAYSTIPGGTYAYKVGTSMASPVVAGLAGLVKSAHPGWDNEKIVAQILGTADNIDHANPSFAGKLGAGMVNAERALGEEFTNARLEVVNVLAQDPAGDNDDELEAGETISLYITIKNFTDSRNFTASLSSSDPWITVVNDTASYGIIERYHAVTNISSPYTFYINPSIPADYTASFELEISTHTIPVATRSFELMLAPTFRPPQIMRPEGSMKNILHTMSDGKVLALMQHSLPNEDPLDTFYTQGIFAAFREVGGTWSALQQLNSNPNSSASEPYMNVGPDEDVHIVFEKNMDSWDNEIFYARYDATTETWSGNQQLTTNAEIFGAGQPEGNYVISADDAGLIHVAWLDHRSGNPQIYYKYHDGIEWQPEVPIYDLNPDLSQPIEFDLFEDSSDNRYLFWHKLWAADSTDYYAMTGSGTTWNTPIFIPGFYKQGLLSQFGDQIYMPYKETSSFGLLELAEFNGTDWSYNQTIGNVSGADWLLRMSDIGTMHLVYRSDEIYRMFNDGLDWSEPLRLTPLGLISANSEIGVDQSYFDHVIVDEYGGYGGNKPAYLTNAPVDVALLASRPVVTDDGIITITSINLHASWSSSHLSGIVSYICAVGSAPGETDIKDWHGHHSITDYSHSLSGNPLFPGQTYYVTICAVSNAVYSSPLGLNDGIVYKSSSNTGSLELDRSVYNCSDTLNITVSDFDIRHLNTQDVTIVTDGGDFETITLTEVQDYSAVFEGTISTSSDSVNTEDGILQIAHGQSFTVTYEDLDDGTGSPATVQSVAMVDCTGPLISNVQVDNITGVSAVVTFDTDEPTCATVRYGLSSGSLTEAASGICEPANYSVSLVDLDPDTTYFYVVDACDNAGNVSTDANDSNCYVFTTLDTLFLDVNLEAAVKEELGISSTPTKTDMLSLTNLSAENIGIVNLTGLEWATNLTTLELQGNQISDISPLSILENLTHLDLFDNLVSDIVPLSGLTNLTWLSLRNNQVSDLLPISALLALETLNLRDNMVSDISPISGLTNLTSLDLNDNEVSDISALSGIASLNILILTSNNVSDLSPISGLTNLNQLYLSENAISDFSAIAGLTSLHTLSLYYGQISDISALAGLTNLTSVWLRSNQISDISALSSLTSLRSLHLDRNNLNTKAYCTYIQMIINNNHGINMYYDSPNPNPITVDCSTNLSELAVFASNWLETGCNEQNDWCNGADLNHVNDVSFADFAEFAELWLAD